MIPPLPREADSPTASESPASELLAGLIAHQDETGAVGRQLVYILLGAGVTPAVRARCQPPPHLVSRQLH
ncbi:MAG TPA: hypothetical protein ENK26_12700 [Gammaproteobacteria bacterium]|nr:hypothetical protein [Gammaproteobacteria bacterium]